MGYIIYFLIGLIVGILGMYLITKSKVSKDAIKESTKEVKDSNPAVEIRKENIQKLEKMIAGKPLTEKITNDEVQEFLDISDATAERYLNDLEHRGLIKQFGEVGQDVYYQKI